MAFDYKRELAKAKIETDRMIAIERERWMRERAAIELEQQRQREMQKTILKEQQRQAALLQKHEAEINKLKERIEQAEEDLNFLQCQIEQWINYGEYLESQRDAAAANGAEWHKWNNKILANDAKVYGLMTRKNRAMAIKRDAERKLSA